ncbi:MAG: HNH endonuclease [Maricaulaceae bacterium]|nr:HNH endonuclease [Maricaulaceae bacterium]
MQVLDRAPQGWPCLVLNADYQPLSYWPLSTWPWQEAIKNVFLDRVDVVSHYRETVRSPSVEMALPSVVALRDYVQQNRTPAFTRYNVWLRDGFACVYCGAGRVHDLTFDHVIPRSRGGGTTWENIVAACAPCNLKKGGRAPREAGLSLIREPYRPTMHQLQAQGRRFPPKYLHESWLDYLYWDVELES